MSVYICIDDTDSLDSIGTGRLARLLAEQIGQQYQVTAVTRHQLFVHSDIPYTSHNSCAVIHLCDIAEEAYLPLFNRAKILMQEHFIEGSDPGIALAGSHQITPGMIAFGFDAKSMVLTQDRARKIAYHAGILLEGLGGTEGGVIGALAGLGLAASGSDGRYIQTGTIREKQGNLTIAEILKTGIEQVITLDGKDITEGMVTVLKFPQPVRLQGKPVLLVDEQEGRFVVVKRN